MRSVLPNEGLEPWVAIAMEATGNVRELAYRFRSEGAFPEALKLLRVWEEGLLKENVKLEEKADTCEAIGGLLRKRALKEDRNPSSSSRTLALTLIGGSIISFFSAAFKTFSSPSSVSKRS